MISAAELAQKSSRLFSLPDIYLRLSRLLNEENSTVDQIAELIALDAALSARLLKVANSPFYNFPAQIETVPRAITLIGSNELTNLVLATSVASSFRGVPTQLMDMDGFWQHNVDTGLVARQLGKLARIRDVDRLFAIGLLHNIGKLMIVSEYPEKIKQIMEGEAGQLPWLREQEVLGFTFAECGAELLKMWQLPASFIDAVAHQHQPKNATTDNVAAALVHIASRAASWMEQETRDDPQLDFIQLIDPWVWQHTDLQLAQMDEAIEFAQIEAWNILSLITEALY